MGYVLEISRLVDSGVHYHGENTLQIGDFLYPYFKGSLHLDPKQYRHPLYSVKRRECAVYVLLEINSGMVYVGSSEEVYDRVSKHKYHIKRKEHDNEEFTKLLQVTAMHDYDVVVLFTLDREEAYRFEQGLIDHYKAEGRLLNYGYDVHRAMLGKKISDEHKEKIRQGNLGKTVSSESRQKMRESRAASEAAQSQFLAVQQARRRAIVLNGTHYPSVSEAVRLTGVPQSSIHKQLRKCGGKTGEGPYVLNYVRSSPQST